jgi:hypothetical protein
VLVSPSLIVSDIALGTTGLLLSAAGTALLVQPASTLVLYAQNEALRLNALALDLARLVGLLLFAVAVLALATLGVRSADAHSSLCYALAYVFFFAAVVHSLQSYVDHGSWVHALARSPVEPIAVLYARLYVPLALSVLNLIAAWCEDRDPPAEPVAANDDDTADDAKKTN